MISSTSDFGHESSDQAVQPSAAALPAFYGRHSLFIAGYTICQSGDDRRTWRDLIAGRGAVSGELFGQFRTVELRNSARILQTVRFCIFSCNAQSRACLCRNCAKPRQFGKWVRIPLGIASLLEEGDEVPQREGTPAKVVGKLEFHETFTRSPFGCYGVLLWCGACLKNLTTPDPNP
jgi:hypothetical protein